MHRYEILDRAPGHDTMAGICYALMRRLRGPWSFQILISDGHTAYLDTPDGLELAMLQFTERGDLNVYIAATGSEFYVSLCTEDPQHALGKVARIVNTTLATYLVRANAGQVLRLAEQNRWSKRWRRFFRSLNSNI